MVDELSTEESAAIEEMMSDDGVEDAVVVEEEQEQPEPEAAEAEEEKPEFKTTREKPPEGFVPHQAMHEERMRRQEAERRLAALEAEAQRRREEAEKAQEPQWADPLVDPDGFKKYQDYQLQQTKEMVMQQQQAIRQRQMQEARAQDAIRLENEFKATVPDYDDAVRALNEARVNELRQYGLDDQRIVAQIAQDANNVYDSARRLGMNPAQLLYQLSQQRGYQPKAQVQDEQAKVEALAEAQRQTQGLGSGGSRSPGRLTVTQMADMSEAELAKLSPDDIARAFGG